MSEPDPLAWAVMVAYCGWDPTERVIDRTVLLDGNGSRLLTLPSLYVTDVSAVQVTDSWGSTLTRTVAPMAYPAVGVLPAVDVGWSENGTLTWHDWCYGAWPSGQRNVAVTYSGGYPDGPPDDLLAALDSVGGRTSSAMGVTSRRAGGVALTYSSTASDGGLLLVEQMVFDRYRIPRVA